MLHLLNHAEVAHLLGKEVTMELMGVFSNRLGTSFDFVFLNQLTIFIIALMETCGGVRGCDLLWTFAGGHSRTAFQKRMEQSWQHVAWLLQNSQKRYHCSQGGEQPVLFR